MENGVNYPLERGHAGSVLFHLEQQREAGDLCDITLRVRGSDIHAHRGVLAACSDYFSAMFSGSYVERDSRLIDLSETFFNADALDQIIKSMYHGDLFIRDSDDVCDMLEICSVLLYEDAKKQCIDCLKTRLCLRNGLKFWFFADRYLDEKSGNRFTYLLQNHFHDYYIDQPEIFKMSAGELSVIFGRNFHKFSTPIQLLGLLLRWFSKNFSEEELASLFKQITETIFSNMNKTVQQYQPVAHLFLSNPERLSQEFSLDLEKCERFCCIVKNLIPKDLKVCPINESRLTLPNSGPFCFNTIHSDMLQTSANNGSEEQQYIDTVLVVAPMPHILEQRFHLYMNYNGDNDKFSETVPLFHVSVYIPETRIWLQLGQISSPPKLRGDKLTDFFDSCLMVYCKDFLYAFVDFGEKNLKCDMRTFEWKSLPPISDCQLKPESIDKVDLKSPRRIFEPISTKQGMYCAVACQNEEVVQIGLLELYETEGSPTSWVEKIAFSSPSALFGFALVTSCHCNQDDRFIFVLLIGRMHAVHCRAMCLAKFDIVKETMEFLCIPEEYLVEPYHWTLFVQKDFLYLAHKTTFMYRCNLSNGETAEENDFIPVWENCSEQITINGSHKLPSLYAKSWGKFRRLNGVAASTDSLWVMVEKRLVDRWHSMTLWQVKVKMDDADAQQQVERHVPSSYSCFSILAPVKLERKRLQGLKLCKCVHPE